MVESNKDGALGHSDMAEERATHPMLWRTQYTKCKLIESGGSGLIAGSSARRAEID